MSSVVYVESRQCHMSTIGFTERTEKRANKELAFYVILCGVFAVDFKRYICLSWGATPHWSTTSNEPRWGIGSSESIAATILRCFNMLDCNPVPDWLTDQKKNRSMTDKQLSTDTAAKCSHDGTAAGDPANATARTAAGTVITSLDKEFRVTTRLLQPAACIVQDNSTDWLLFARTLWIYLPNLTFLALPIPEIIGGTSKSSGVPGYAHAPFSPTILISICSHEPSEYDTTRYWTLMTYSAR